MKAQQSSGDGDSIKRGPGRPAVGPVRYIRASDAEWERWEQAAALEGVTVSAWVRSVCNRAATAQRRKGSG